MALPEVWGSLNRFLRFTCALGQCFGAFSANLGTFLGCSRDNFGLLGSVFRSLVPLWNCFVSFWSRLSPFDVRFSIYPFSILGLPCKW